MARVVLLAGSALQNRFEPAKCNAHRVESQASVRRASGPISPWWGGRGDTRKGTRDRLSCVGEDLRTLQVVLHCSARGVAVLAALLLCTRPAARSARGKRQS
jgi:hypothetical protein